MAVLAGVGLTSAAAFCLLSISPSMAAVSMAVSVVPSQAARLEAMLMAWVSVQAELLR
jgi:hypothetical protein